MVYRLQSVAVGNVISNRTLPEAVVAGHGGRVMLLGQPSITAGPILAQSEDFGFGGAALAVADLNGDGDDEIVFATSHAPTDTAASPFESRVVVLDHTTSGLVKTGPPVPLGVQGSTQFAGYGACGIAIAELTGPSSPAQIIVTTQNGELVVFGQSNGVIQQPPLFRTVVEGSLGAFNSIIVANLIGGPKPEIYIAGSTGIHRFDVQ